MAGGGGPFRRQRMLIVKCSMLNAQFFLLPESPSLWCMERQRAAPLREELGELARAVGELLGEAGLERGQRLARHRDAVGPAQRLLGRARVLERVADHALREEA